MALYELAEFASYLQSDVDTATATLLRDLITGLVQEIDGHDYAVDVPSATVKAIGLEAAARAYRNPEGVTSKTRNIDDYGATDRWDAAGAGVFLTDDERSRIVRLAGGSGAAFTITPSYDSTTPFSSSPAWFVQ